MIGVRNMYNDYYQAERKSISAKDKPSPNGHGEQGPNNRRQRVLR